MGEISGVHYIGRRQVDGRCDVRVFSAFTGQQGRKLPLRLDLWNHSPTGFEWGYGGSGPAQLALALLAHALDDDDRAVRLHQRFKREVIARIQRDQIEWTLYRDHVIKLAFECEAAQVAAAAMSGEQSS